jgi:protease IV
VIVEGRNLPEERVRELADGRVYSGLQAREIGLVDSFGGVDEAAEISQDLAGVDEATVVRYVQPETFTDALLASFAPDKPDALQIAEEVGMTLEPKPYYLYLPGA